ncbi:hypothetical protein AB6A40_007599 [Gnathostoma spinigerum]|uniref:Uncharacterized protein n=1 Tax=Gnathostoma spinigerum TaxID=75299 RepID=A0ABD6EMX7_9BILA
MWCSTKTISLYCDTRNDRKPWQSDHRILSDPHSTALLRVDESLFYSDQKAIKQNVSRNKKTMVRQFANDEMLILIRR